MFYSFLESIKFTAHIFPLAIFRIGIGFYFLNQSMDKLNTNYLVTPRLARDLSELLSSSQASVNFKYFISEAVIPSWQFFAYLLFFLQLFIGFSFISGFLVRISSILGVVLCTFYLLIEVSSITPFFQILLLSFISMGFIGAGRCLGMDYFFYKRYNGWLW
ncbi:MAG: DoxX family membrane protein [Bdellovibrionaceae bacterium]|nr:DoxX family membrane protein [Pseudobdellovibrionaceae bacterium]